MPPKNIRPEVKAAADNARTAWNKLQASYRALRESPTRGTPESRQEAQALKEAHHAAAQARDSVSKIHDTIANKKAERARARAPR